MQQQWAATPMREYKYTKSMRWAMSRSAVSTNETNDCRKEKGQRVRAREKRQQNVLIARRFSIYTHTHTQSHSTY